MSSTLHIGRQPIVNRDGELFAYELLFRDSQHNRATVLDDFAATSHVIRNAFGEFGLGHVLENRSGFINVSADLLLSDTIELLPAATVVLEILETVELSEAVVARCAELAAKGFRLALDDVLEFDARHQPLLPHIHVVKIDVLACTPAQLAHAVAAFRPFGVMLLAEKIDSMEQYAQCRELGFDLFQGYFFARPTILTSKQSSPPNWALLQLLGLLNRDASLAELVQAFKPSPQMSFTLLKLVNSVACGAPCHIDSIEHAIAILGRRQLMRWVQLLLFTRQEQGLPKQDPLVNLAVCRGRLMELLAQQRHPGNRSLAEQGFMVGLLSLLDALYQQPRDTLLNPLQLQDDVRTALLDGSGTLGLLLAEVLALESSEPSPPDLASDAAGLLLEAMQWTDRLLLEVGG
ncbi:EAL and HDOD domain-containing protein [Chitinilyticum piscinae]|uniref:EAL domain-containing protein n=1 Tax=Chitinilyticum piscinae TaxID=2866724 RepID=A0A8J7FHQ4_9NEIS|nr:EAL domain-containing protein [Chitinilyticum piscinae]MBE9609663.1 EAL domain-containing protein [Chitinilyticum piscinae]